jgi:hypothetical protein
MAKFYSALIRVIADFIKFKPILTVLRDRLNFQKSFLIIRI